VCQPDHGEQAFNVMDECVRSGAIDLVVVDSVSALVPRSEVEGDIGTPQARSLGVVGQAGACSGACGVCGGWWERAGGTLTEGHRWLMRGVNARAFACMCVCKATAWTPHQTHTHTLPHTHTHGPRPLRRLVARRGS
jgi:hypothetical protein